MFPFFKKIFCAVQIFLPLYRMHRGNECRKTQCYRERKSIFMKHKTSLFIAALTALCVAQTSCGFIVFNHPEESSAPTDETTLPPETTPAPETDPPETTPPRDLRAESESRLDALTYRNLSASSVIIASAVNADLICPSGETTSEVVAARNLTARAVESKYNTKIIVNPVSASTMLAEAKAAYASDMYYADLLAVPQNMVGAFQAAGILANMYSLPFTYYSKPCYYDDLNDAAVLGNSLLAVFGAASFDPDSLACVYFNRDLTDTDIYELVTSGKWTLERFAETAKAAASLDGVYGHGSDFDRSSYLDKMIAAAGIDYVTNPKGELPTLDYMENSTASKTSALVDRLYTLFYTDGSYSQSGAGDLFGSGRLMFFTGTLSDTAHLADSSTGWGLLPLPKADEDQTAYYSPISDDSPAFCALANTPNFETSGLILEALNEASYEYIEDIYFSELRDWRLRDNSSLNMLEIILKNPRTDFTRLMSSGFTNLAAASYEAVRNAVTSSASLTAYYNRYAAAAGRELNGSTVIY